MAYDLKLAGRVREALGRRDDIEERAMFGGLAFMTRGHMCCGIVKDKLMVRVDPAACDRLLGEPGAAPMDFTGRPMRGFLYVTAPGIATPSGLRTWVSRALEFADSRPPKAGPPVRASQAGRSKRRGRAKPR